MNYTAYIVGTFLWSALTGLLIFHLVRKWLLFQRMPPGPYGWPIIGSMFHLLKNNAVEEFKKYKEKYGGIFSVSVGNFNVVVINNYKLIQEAVKMDEFTGRPNFHFWDIRNYGIRNRGILFCDGGPVWQEVPTLKLKQRRFALRTLRDFGFGKQSMECLLQNEFDDLSKCLRKDLGKPISLSGLFNASVLNSLWFILTGKRYELDDPIFKDAIDLLIENNQGVFITSPVFFYLWPVKYNLIKPGRWAVTAKMRLKIRELIDKQVEEHFATFDGNNVPRDFIDSYINHMNLSEPNSSFNSEEGKFNLRIVLFDLFVAGAETTSTTLLWSILYMTQNLEVQSKVQAEIDSVIGKDRPPSRNDKQRMVYVEAVLNEVHRMCSLLPMSVYHSMLEDKEFEGFLLPKGSVVFLNLFDSHHDPKYWKDPEVFRPERFLDPSGTQLIKHDAFMPFGTGRRQCLGEPLARDTLFIFFTSMLQAFRFEIDPAMESVELQGTPTFISAPQPFKVVLSNRV